MAITGFKRTEVEDFFFEGKLPRRAGWAQIAGVVRRKLDMLHYAHSLEDMRSPPGNRLEPLRGELVGFYSIRVNEQWRIIFRWAPDGPVDVDVVDYHR